MPKEIEAKFLNIDKDEIEEELKDIGAKKVFDERLLRRYVYNLPIDDKDAWARVRDEGDKITMSYKRVAEEKVDGVEEVELEIDSFEKGRKFLRALGLNEKAYQETKRMRYEAKRGAVELDIDTWPGLEPWLEIEAESQDLVREYAEKLGFDWKDAYFGGADVPYAEAYEDISRDWICNECARLEFGNLPDKLKN